MTSELVNSTTDDNLMPCTKKPLCLPTKLNQFALPRVTIVSYYTLTHTIKRHNRTERRRRQRADATRRSQHIITQLASINCISARSQVCGTAVVARRRHRCWMRMRRTTTRSHSFTAPPRIAAVIAVSSSGSEYLHRAFHSRSGRSVWFWPTPTPKRLESQRKSGTHTHMRTCAAQLRPMRRMCIFVRSEMRSLHIRKQKIELRQQCVCFFFVVVL